MVAGPPQALNMQLQLPLEHLGFPLALLCFMHTLLDPMTFLYSGFGLEHYLTILITTQIVSRYEKYLLDKRDWYILHA